MNPFKKISPVVVMVCLVAAPSAWAQQPSKPAKAKPTLSSLQMEISNLKESQQQVLDELAEIKALLTERSARVETPVMAKEPPFINVSVFGEPFKGEAKARVAILEYSDFDCTFCARYATEIYPKLNEAYVKTGKVKYFFRDLPLPEHATAFFKARLARCAGDQGKFWEAHDYLFADQKPLAPNELSPFIRALALDPEKLGVCIGSDAHSEGIRRSMQSADRMKVRGTPAYLIGTLNEDGTILKATQLLMGAESLEAFQKMLDEMLGPTAGATKP